MITNLIICSKQAYADHSSASNDTKNPKSIKCELRSSSFSRQSCANYKYTSFISNAFIIESWHFRLQSICQAKAENEKIIKTVICIMLFQFCRSNLMTSRAVLFLTNLLRWTELHVKVTIKSTLMLANWDPMFVWVQIMLKNSMVWFFLSTKIHSLIAIWQW